MDLRAALTERVLVLDGGLATELERRGHDLSGPLWSARLLDEAPAAVLAAHRAFRDAGAEVITTASYQATPEGFARAGLDRRHGERLLRRSVALARRAADEVDRPVWVAASVGPYAVLAADGSEYTGDYGDAVDRRRLREFHRPRLEMLAAAGADVLAVETVPSREEAEALLLELEALGHPAWLSLTTVTVDDEVLTRRGEPAAEVYAAAGSVAAVVAVGVNCTEPAGVAAAVGVAARASGRPVLAYPNRGEGWDAEARAWTPGPEFDLTAAAPAWIEAGARAVGGCCRVTPEQIARLAVGR